MAVGGVFLPIWALRKFHDLPNYLRLAVMLPLLYSVALLHVDTYANWSTAPGLDRSINPPAGGTAAAESPRRAFARRGL